MTRVALLALVAMGCRGADSVVVVGVDVEPRSFDVRQLRAVVVHGMESSIRFFPKVPSAEPIEFETSFALVIPRGRRGELGLTVDGLDAESMVVARGKAKVDIVAGGRAEIKVLLCGGECPMLVRDGGADVGGRDAEAVADAEIIASFADAVGGDAGAADAVQGRDAAQAADAPPADVPADRVEPDLPWDLAPDRWPRRIMMIVSNLALPGAGDKAIRGRLEAKGYVVTVALDQTFTGAQARTYDLVLVSDSSRSAEIGTKLTDVAVPVLCLDSLLYPPLGMTGAAENTDHGFVAGETQVQVGMAGHPLAAGMGGRTTILDAAGRMGWGVPPATAVVVATLPGAGGRAAVFGYEAGAQMGGGRRAMGRRTGWPVGMAAGELTDAGWRMFEGAVGWTMGE